MWRNEYLAVVVVAVLLQVFGMLWYGPHLFMQEWLGATGLDAEIFTQPPVLAMVLVFISHLALGCGLLWVNRLTGAKTFLAGARNGLRAFITFVAFGLAAGYLFMQYGFDLIWLDGVMLAINFTFAGGVLALWAAQGKAAKAPVKAKAAPVKAKAKKR